MLLILFGAAVCLLVAYLIVSSFGTIPSWRTIQLFNKLPGPTDDPFFFGSLFKILKLDYQDVIPWVKTRLDAYDGWYACYFLGQPTVIMAKPECIEPILTSSKNIDKGPEYKFVQDWLQYGLLTSSGEKWKQRRKLLTPSFHFKILEDNAECMNRNWRKVVQKFLDAKGAPVEPLHIMGRGALDIICETAMGTVLEKNVGSEEYVSTVKRTTQNSVKRALNPLMRNDFVFRNSSFGKEYMKDVGLLHGFTEKVIQDRKAAYMEEKRSNEMEYSDLEGKKRKVFLDSLIEIAEKEGLSISDIREEVDTFMFAGHDTTSTALQYILLHLGHNPEVQEKAYQEQLEIFGYSDRDATKDDLSRMHYLDQVIKEGLRLNPPAPQIARILVEDVKLPDGNLIPAGTKILINIFALHRNSKQFPDPDVFKPERFSLEESKNRHPYSYIPFSAGPRNCIGQKFALLEMKIGLSTILRSCKINAITKFEDLKYEMLIILKPSTPIRIEILPRNQF